MEVPAVGRNVKQQDNYVIIRPHCGNMIDSFLRHTDDSPRSRSDG